MALPVKQAGALASDMAKKGLISMGQEPKKEMDEPAMDDGMDDGVPEDIRPVLDDMDAMMPGMGKLVMEMVEKMMAKHGEPDGDEGSGL